MDAGGFATYILPLNGGKLWIIRVEPAAEPGEDLKWQVDGEYQYIVLYIGPGDFLCANCLPLMRQELNDALFNRAMLPGCVHIVYTFDDTFCEGGHFYHSGCLRRSLHALAIEHAVGREVTNTQHPQSPLLLLQLVGDFYGMVTSKDGRPTHCACPCFCGYSLS